MSTYRRGKDSVRRAIALESVSPEMRSSRTTRSVSRSVAFDDCSARASTAGTSGTPAWRNTASWRENSTKSIAPGLKKDGSARCSAKLSFFFVRLVTTAAPAGRLGQEDIPLDLLERSDVVRDLLEGVHAHRLHALADRLRADRVRRRALLEERLHSVRELEELEHAEPVVIAGEHAAVAARALGEDDLL